MANYNTRRNRIRAQYNPMGGMISPTPEPQWTVAPLAAREQSPYEQNQATILQRALMVLAALSQYAPDKFKEIFQGGDKAKVPKVPDKKESRSRVRQYDQMSDMLNQMREYQDSRVGALSPGPMPGRPSSRDIYLKNRRRQVGW